MSRDEVLTSLSNPRVKRVVALRKGHRAKREGVLIAEGWREVERAVAAGLRVVAAYAVEGEAMTRLAGLLRNPGPPGTPGCAPASASGSDSSLVTVTPGVLAKMAYHREPEGVLAVVERPAWGWADLEKDLEKGSGTVYGVGEKTVPDPFLLVAVGMDKPGNLGAMVRTAAAAGLAGVIATNDGESDGAGAVDLFNPNAIRASTGAVFEMPVVCCTEDEAIAFLAGSLRDPRGDGGETDGTRTGWRVLAAMVDGAVDYREMAADGRPTAVVIGPEDRGLSERWREAAEATGGAAVKIPMAKGGVVDSLNASVAAGVVVYGFMR